MPHTIARVLEFDAAHRIVGHEGKCKDLHGHRYKAMISVTAGLDSLGRVIDFGVIKEKVGAWIDRHWDHNIILSSKDPIFELCKLAELHRYIMNPGMSIEKMIFGNRCPFTMPVEMNPTAENLAEVLYKQSRLLLSESHLTVTEVRIWETPNCCADFET